MPSRAAIHDCPGSRDTYHRNIRTYGYVVTNYTAVPRYIYLLQNF